MRHLFGLMIVGVIAAAVTPVRAEPLIWGVDAEQLEYRAGEAGKGVYAWDFDALVGTDELKLVWRSEAEYERQDSKFETLENQLRLQVPVSAFFDALVGVRLDTPKNVDRLYGVVGLHGLTRQWFEIDADLYLGDHPAARFEVDYEGLLTNHITLTPSIEVELPFNDDEAYEMGAWGPKAEFGARLSYDLLDRAFSPYLGVHYEQLFGETKSRAEAESRDSSALYGVIGVKTLF